MQAPCIWIGIVLILCTTLACVVPLTPDIYTDEYSPRSSDTFVESLAGQITFVDWADPRQPLYTVSLPDIAITEIGSYPRGETVYTFRDGKQKLILKMDQDTNRDGVIGEYDLYSVYLQRSGEEKARLVPLPFQVGRCTWGAENTIAACSFDSRDVLPKEDLDPYTFVVYLVNLESGELVRRLSDPSYSCWLPKLSFDGRMVAFQANIMDQSESVAASEIQIVSTQTGKLVYAIKDSMAREPVWAPDSLRLAFVTGTSVTDPNTGWPLSFDDVLCVDLNDNAYPVVNVTQTSRFLKPSYSSMASPVYIYSLIWLPDGKAIASIWRVWESDEIWIVSVDGSEWLKVYASQNEHYHNLFDWPP